MHIRVDDIVEVITGEDRGTRGKVLKVLRADAKLVVEGINRVYRHVRRSQRNLQGGRLSKEMPVSLSNVLLVCNSCGKPTRTGARLRDDGGKDRYCKKCSTAIGSIAPGHGAKADKNKVKKK
jgi:large subunit ribosomal protein L24